MCRNASQRLSFLTLHKKKIYSHLTRIHRHPVTDHSIVDWGYYSQVLTRLTRGQHVAAGTGLARTHMGFSINKKKSKRINRIPKLDIQNILIAHYISYDTVFKT